MPLLLLSLSLGLAVSPPLEPGRWPRWPTELASVAGALGTESSPPAESTALREEALANLRPYASPVILPWLIRALGDQDVRIQRAALVLCRERGLRECVEPALPLWSSDPNPDLAATMLPLFALVDRGPAFEVLLTEATRDTLGFRELAIELLGNMPLADPQRQRAANTLAVALASTSSATRRVAAEGLGLMGDRRYLVALSQLLVDPDPQLQAAAATALGQIGDVQALQPLLRALERPGTEPLVIQALLTALGRLPGPEAPRWLLQALDMPPVGVPREHLAGALGLRPDPDPWLLDALGTRLRDPGTRGPALMALRLMGVIAGPTLRAELERPADPQLALDLTEALAAIDVQLAVRSDARPEEPSNAATAAVPPPPIPAGTPPLIASAIQEVFAQGYPTWSARLVQALRADLGQAETLGPRRWTLVLASMGATQPVLGRTDSLAIARLVAWSADPTLAPQDRALALWALAGVHTRGSRGRPVLRALRESLADPDPQVRALANLAWNTQHPRPDDRGLLDPSPRVRVMAALAAWARGPTPAQAKQLNLLALTDPHPAVRLAAGLGKPVVHGPTQWRRATGIPPTPRLGPEWVEVSSVVGGPLWVPIVRIGSLAGFVLPGAP